MIFKRDYSISSIFSNTVYRRFSISFLVFGIIAIIYIIFWYGMVIYLKNTIEGLRDYSAEQGVLASYGKLEITGFPINFHISINDLQFQIPYHSNKDQKYKKDKKWIWLAQRAAVELKPWNFNNVKFDLSGSNRLSLKDNGTLYEFVSEAKLINIDAKIQGSWLEKFKIKIEDIKISEKLSEVETSIKSASFSTQVLLQDKTLFSEATKNPSRVLQMKLKGVYLPKELKLPFDNHLDKIFVNLKIIEDLSPVFNIRNLRTWRDAGGIIDIDSFEGVSGSLKTYGSGTLAFDQKLQPLLAMSVNFEGIIPFIDRLKAFGFIRSNTALLAKVILSGISRRSASGKRSVSLPLTIQDRKLSVGPLSLMTLPSINWDKRFSADD